MNSRLRGVLAASLVPLVLGLAACGGEAEPAASPAPSAPATPAAESATPTPTAAPTQPANNLDAIKVEGEPGKEPKVTVPAPWGIDETRTKVITPGSGAKIAETATVEVNYVGVNGRTGEKFDDSFSRGQTVAFPLEQVVPGFRKGLAGQQVGSRVLIGMPGSDGYDQAGGSPQAGIEVGDTLVFAVDIVSASLDAPEGDPVPPKEGLPTVDFAGTSPKVTIPPAQPPAQLVVQPLIQGKGAEVKETDTITARYQAVAWSNGQVIEDGYGRPAEQGPLASMIPAWKEALKGQKVGSRLLIIAPPDKAYGAQGYDKLKVGPNETVVYVVDLLFTQAAQQ